MAKKDSTEEETKTNASGDTDNKNDLVNFVANNILNSITLNQVVTLVQNVSLRDANTIVTEADEDKLKEITEAFADAVKHAQAEAVKAEEAAAKEAE